jgi:hypothetical protein
MYASNRVDKTLMRSESVKVGKVLTCLAPLTGLEGFLPKDLS